MYTKNQKNAQIDILNMVMSNLCGAELNEAGRKAISKIINNLENDLKNGTYDKQ